MKSVYAAIAACPQHNGYPAAQCFGYHSRTHRKALTGENADSRIAEGATARKRSGK